MSVLFVTWWGYLLGGVILLGLLGGAKRIGIVAARVLTRNSLPGDEGVVVSFGLGLGVLGSATFAFGLVGLLFAPPLWLAIAAFTALAIRELVALGSPSVAWGRLVRAFHRALPRPLTPVTRIVIAVVAVVTALSLLNIEMGWDAFTYHLRIPSFYIYRHKIYDVWHHYCGVFPSHVEMIYTFSKLLNGDTLVRFVNFSLGVLVLVSAWSLTRRISNATFSLGPKWTVLLVAACPTFLNLTTRSYIDLGFAFYCSVSILVFLRWWETGSRSAVVLSGLLAGWGMSSKYVGVLVLAGVLAAAFPRWWTGRRARVTSASALWCVAALVPLLPWLARNWVMRANPVSPFLGGLFGVAEELPEFFVGIFGAVSPIASFAASLPVRAGALVFNFGAIDGPMAPFVAGLFPLVVFAPLSGLAAVLRRAVLGYSLAWFVLCPDVRFFLPVLPALCALAVVAAGSLMDRGGVVRSGVRTFLEAGVIVGLLYSAGIQWIFYSPASVPLGFESRAAKIERTLSPAPFTGHLKDFVNEHLPRDARILYLCHFNTYHVERECIADFHFGEAHITRIIRKGRTEWGIARELRRLGIRWLLSTGTGAAQYADIPGFFDVSEQGWRAMKRLLAHWTDVAWQDDEYTLYRVRGRQWSGRLPAFPVYEALMFRDADRDLGEGRFADALVDYLSPPELLRNVGSTFVRQGDALRGVGRIKEAIEAYGRAREYGVESSRLNLGFALALLRAGRPGEALLYAQAARGRNSHSAHIAATLAGIYATMGQAGAARRWIGEALRRSPGSAGYLEMADRIEARFQH